MEKRELRDAMEKRELHSASARAAEPPIDTQTAFPGKHKERELEVGD